MSVLSVSVVGACYTGGELIRLLSMHPKVKLSMVTSRKNAGKPVSSEIPVLRGKLNLKFKQPDISRITDKCDIVFIATPHTVSMEMAHQIVEAGVRVIDLSADFRLKSPELFEKYYSVKHKAPYLPEEDIYGLSEINREKIKSARVVACPGCFSTSAILGLYPIAKKQLIKETVFIDAKTGSSGLGRNPSLADNHPEGANIARSYSPGEQRHIPEIEQGAIAVFKH